MKHLFDIVFSLFGLVILSPLLFALAILIKREDGGPVFYRGVRVGRNGRPFRIFKFRTMVVNAEKIGGASTADDDPRITEIGKFVRKYKLDELPQLINVLKGEMSFVGPRPEVPHYVNMFEKIGTHTIFETQDSQSFLTGRNMSRNLLWNEGHNFESEARADGWHGGGNSLEGGTYHITGTSMRPYIILKTPKKLFLKQREFRRPQRNKGRNYIPA